MSKIQAWPFLVSRNQFLDYRTVVAPDFMCEDRIASLLAKTAEGELINDDSAYYREIYGSKSGDLTIIYRVRDAHVKEISEEILKDSFGREIYLIEGVVLKGIQPSLVITIENLELHHQKLLDNYRDFWEWVSPQSAIPSEITLLELVGKPLQYRQVDDYLIGSSSPQPDKKGGTDNSQTAQSPSIDFFSLHNEVHFVKFINNSSLLVHEFKNAVYILRLQPKEESILIKGNSFRYICRVAISTNLKLVCTANIVTGVLDRNILKILDLKSSTERDLREGNPSELGRVNALAFSCDDSAIAVFEKSNIPLSPQTSLMSIKLIDTKSGGIRGNELNWHTSYIKCIEASLCDDIFASGDGKGFVKIWNWRTLKMLGSLPSHSSTVNAIAFSPRQKILVSGGDDGKIKIISYQNSKIEDQGLLGEHSDSCGGVNTLAFSPNGKIVASGDDDGKIKLWDVKNKKQIAELSEHRKAVMSVSFSPDGKLLASGSKDHSVKIWQPEISK